MISELKRAALLATIFEDFLSKEHDTIKLMASHAKIHEYILIKKTFGITNSRQKKKNLVYRPCLFLTGSVTTLLGAF